MYRLRYRRMTPALHLVLQLQLLALAFRDLELVSRGAGLHRLDLPLKRFVPLCELGQMGVQRHRFPPSDHSDDRTVTQHCGGVEADSDLGDAAAASGGQAVLFAPARLAERA